ALALDPRFAREGLRDDDDGEVRLAAGARAGVAGVMVRLVDHLQARRLEGGGQLLRHRRGNTHEGSVTRSGLELCARGMRGHAGMWCDLLAWSKRASHTWCIMAKPRPFDFEEVLRPHRPPVAERRCDVAGCDCTGEYRAPKSRRQLTDYFWFCLD